MEILLYINSLQNDMVSHSLTQGRQNGLQVQQLEVFPYVPPLSAPEMDVGWM